MFNKSACLIENKNFSFTCVDSETPVFTVCIRERPFHLKRGGGDYVFFSKKINILTVVLSEKKILNETQTITPAPPPSS